MNQKKRTHSSARKKRPVKSTRMSTRTSTRGTSKHTRRRQSRPTINTPRRRHYRKRQTYASRQRTRSSSNNLLKSLSSINIASILNSFYTLRSTVNDLRVSLEKLDRLMNSAYQLIGMIQNRQLPLSLPPANELHSANELPSAHEQTEWDYRNNSFGEERGDERKEENAPLGGLLEQVDIGQLMSMLQSPIFQSLIKQFFKPK